MKQTSEEFKRNIAANIKKQRLSNQLTQQEVAKALGVSQSAYVNYEHARVTPRVHTLLKLTEIFNVTMDELLGYPVKESLKECETMEEKLRYFFYIVRRLTPEQRQKLVEQYRRWCKDHKESP